MFNKRRFFLVNKLSALIVLFFIVLYYLPLTLSKYESNASGSAVTSIAYYVVNPEYYTDNIYLTNLEPSSVPYVYTFTISNYDDEDNGAEVDIIYNLSVVTTTNLPLRYALYEVIDGVNNNVVVGDDIDVDDYDTYFRILSTDDVYMSYRDTCSHTYSLYIYFDDIYDSYVYQDLIEGIRIVIDSRQVLDSDDVV